MHHDTFNADFYIAAATVIPLLYLTLTLQGTMFEDFLKRTERYRTKGIPNLGAFLSVTFSMTAFATVTYLIVASGFLGELLAFIALFKRSTNPVAETVTFTSVVALIFLVTVTLMLRIISVVNPRLKPNERKKPNDQPSEQKPSEGTNS